MTTITKTPLTAPAEQSEERELTVDSLNMRNAVIGDGLVLTQSDRKISLHSIDRGRVEHIGTFANAGEALAALDQLDVEF